jgi:hypothetical protein
VDFPCKVRVTTVSLTCFIEGSKYTMHPSLSSSTENKIAASFNFSSQLAGRIALWGYCAFTAPGSIVGKAHTMLTIAVGILVIVSSQ